MYLLGIMLHFHQIKKINKSGQILDIESFNTSAATNLLDKLLKRNVASGPQEAQCRC